MLLLVRNPQRGICLADMPWGFLVFYLCGFLQGFFSNKEFVLPVHFVSFSFNIWTNDISFTFFSFQVMPHQEMALRLGSVLSYQRFIQLETKVRVDRAVRSEHYHVWSYPFPCRVVGHSGVFSSENSHCICISTCWRKSWLCGLRHMEKTGSEICKGANTLGVGNWGTKAHILHTQANSIMSATLAAEYCHILSFQSQTGVKWDQKSVCFHLVVLKKRGAGWKTLVLLQKAPK